MKFDPMEHPDMMSEIAERISDGILMRLLVEGAVVFANAALKTMFPGLVAGEQPEALLSVLTEEGRARFDDLTTLSSEAETRVLECVGEPMRWLEERRSRIRSPVGQLVLSRLRDITTEHEERLAETRRMHRLEHLFSRVPAFVVALERDGRIRAVNPYFEKFSGWSHAELVGQRWEEMFGRGPALMAEVHTAAVVEPMDLLTRRGAIRRVEWRASDVDGEILAVGVDVTELSLSRDHVEARNDELQRHVAIRTAQLEQEVAQHAATSALLLESHQLFEALFDGPDQICYVDRECRCIRVNKPFAARFQREPEFFVGKRIDDIVQGTRADALLEQVLSTGEPLHVEAIVPKVDGAPPGEKRYFDMTVTPVRGSDGEIQGVLGSLTDVTDREKRRRELNDHATVLEGRVRRRTRELENANRELESFAYSVSHDLRAPLRAIDGYVAAVLEEYGFELDERALGYLSRVRVSTLRMAILIDRLLELARVGQERLDLRVVSLASLASDCVEDLKSQTFDRRVEVTIEGDERMLVDGELLRLVFQNLLTNAWKFTREIEDARIHVAIGRHRGDVRVSVKDNGVGFDPLSASNLFEPFRRLHHIEDYEGSGVGLAIVRRIIGRHGGEVGADSDGKSGAEFWFTLAEVEESGRG